MNIILALLLLKIHNIIQNGILIIARLFLLSDPYGPRSVLSLTECTSFTLIRMILTASLKTTNKWTFVDPPPPNPFVLTPYVVKYESDQQQVHGPHCSPFSSLTNNNTTSGLQLTQVHYVKICIPSPVMETSRLHMSENFSSGTKNPN